MTAFSVISGGHLGDDALLQLLDGETGSPVGARGHLGACEPCAARLAKLGSAAELLHGALPDVVMPRLDFARVTRRRRIWLIPIPVAAAATLALLASAAAATPPVRAWILRQFAPEVLPPTTAPTTPTIPTPTSGIIASFAPSDTVLVIRIDRRQAKGALELVVAGTDRISAQAIGGASAEELLVLPGELRVANTAASVADYRVTIPTSVHVVRVVLGGAELAVVRVSADLYRRLDLR